MDASDIGRPIAFVIMPFGSGFDEIYDLFLIDTLTLAGFEVRRADDICGAQNILKDIVQGIANCDLIVADLTDSNPNVYYELGLAHGLGKPVILLTQEIDDLPFDLRSYRVISYKTHFADMTRAREQLGNLAAGLLSGAAEFGSPASDFLETSQLSAGRHNSTPASEGEPGLLDHMAEMEEGFERLGESLEKFGSRTEKLGDATTTVTSRIKKLQDNPHSDSSRKTRTLVMGLATTLSDYAKFLSTENGIYSSALEQTGTALESIVRAQDAQSTEERAQLESFLTDLDKLQTGAQEGLAAMSEMAETLRETPPVERTFGRAKDRAVGELRRLTDNIEQTISMVSRTREIGQAKLNRPEEDAG